MTSRYLQKRPAVPIGIFATARWEGSPVQIKHVFRGLLTALGDSCEEINPDRALQAAAPTHQGSVPCMRHCDGQR
ncbi:hypothetical protein MAXJ12_26788 [Mesorhizobium alhagi CCNWXJ12-2]|uniref:Uncharacterized protein n=1 Tax=Mesorhizobium alhagi CCNWXJ12-2 TaxID=1107882 RepID=H0HYS3_9HYPH|nr:hypothetical protein MAXJ12_26788 [Mesorhizobium alhagi CCNWXJ12-2]